SWASLASHAKPPRIAETRTTPSKTLVDLARVGDFAARPCGQSLQSRQRNRVGQEVNRAVREAEIGAAGVLAAEGRVAQILIEEPAVGGDVRLGEGPVDRHGGAVEVVIARVVVRPGPTAVLLDDVDAGVNLVEQRVGAIAFAEGDRIAGAVGDAGYRHR